MASPNIGGSLFSSTSSLLFIVSLSTTLLLLPSPSSSSLISFNYTTFTGGDWPDFLHGNNDSNIDFGALQITRDTNNPGLGRLKNSTGRILYKDKFELWKGSENGSSVASFETTFVLNVVPQEGIGEGLAFVLAEDTAVPGDSHGQWLGLVNRTTNGSSKNRIVAVEFDTRKSSDDDLDGTMSASTSTV